MTSLQTKFLLFLLLIPAAPLYLVVRYFYGRTFFRMLLFALLLNFAAWPFFLDYLRDSPTYGPIAGRYIDHDFHGMTLFVALHILPFHFGWSIYHRISGDGRYDLDAPGRPPIPLIHPWFVDLPLAALFPFLVLNGASLPSFALPTPAWLPFTLPTLYLDPAWFNASIVLAIFYAMAAMVSVPAPRFRFRKRAKPLPKPVAAKPSFDVASIASMPDFQPETLAELQKRRPENLQRLTSAR